MLFFFGEIMCFCMFQHFAHLSPGEFMLVRQTLLNFFQDMHIRVSESCFQSKYVIQYFQWKRKNRKFAGKYKQTVTIV